MASLELAKLLGLDQFFQQHIPQGEEHVSWSLVSSSVPFLETS